MSFPRFFRFFALSSINPQQGKVLVNQLDRIVVGFAKLTDFYIAKRKYGCILWLAVHPNYRQKGIASGLVQAGIEDLKHAGAEAIFVSIQRRNTASLATFRKKGFRDMNFTVLWLVFSWRIFGFYRAIWYAPSEVVLMYN
ncbi:MAG TPA: GNAT family N-acetyltransferase [Candidatus Sulfotelmatobacter sp.]|nr:GNAT family N-acetyltransferase [Candidatus Sulfotelmatobacter sp.]